jgi:hypothetical protein
MINYCPSRHTPFDDDYPCEVCGGFDTIRGKGPNQCVCPECPVCGEVGDPTCYEDHGMQFTVEQKQRMAEADRREQARECLSP